MTQDPTPAELAALLNGPRDAEAREQIRAIMRRKRMAAEQFGQQADEIFRQAKKAQLLARVEYDRLMDQAWAYAELLENNP